MTKRAVFWGELTGIFLSATAPLPPSDGGKVTISNADVSM